MVAAGPLNVPRLAAGDRFVLRAWEIGDLPLVREASGDDYIPLITTVPSAYSQEGSEAFIRRQWERASTGSGYPFVIVRVDDGRPLGTVGLWLREFEEGRASLGYWVVGSARGQGVAAEALRSVAAWALGDLRIPRLQLHVEPWNTASQRTAERVGFQREGLLRSWQQVGEERRDMFVYSMLGNDLSSLAAG
ncbi:GNAT family N-acetyltransferase [Kribbella sp. C-35]|uniref:GNAT family N-acetyltransferase n=1 Tax=Kribbella sp. C-35 TaxID=2789276 RepID=UPI00397CC510